MLGLCLFTCCLFKSWSGFIARRISGTSREFRSSGHYVYKSPAYICLINSKPISILITRLLYILIYQDAETKNLNISTNLNLAVCYIKIKDYERARKFADKALVGDPESEY